MFNIWGFFLSFLEIPESIFLVEGETGPEGIGNLSAHWKGEWKKESFFS